MGLQDRAVLAVRLFRCFCECVRAFRVKASAGCRWLRSCLNVLYDMVSEGIVTPETAHEILADMANVLYGVAPRAVTDVLHCFAEQLRRAKTIDDARRVILEAHNSIMMLETEL